MKGHSGVLGLISLHDKLKLEAGKPSRQSPSIQRWEVLVAVCLAAKVKFTTTDFSRRCKN